MKRLFNYFLLPAFVLYMGSCKKTGTNVPVGLASLTTAGISAITTNSANSGGTVTNDGGAAVTARGVCWSTSASPTVSDSKTSDGIGSGSFTSSLTSLTANTTYNVRAYATNSAGTAYGNAVSFTTTTPVAISPWQMMSSGVSTSQRGIIQMYAPDTTTCYGVLYDANNYLGDLLHDITITHDGGATWHSQTIAGLANYKLTDVSATTASTVHVIGVNSVTGGGGIVFRSTDGGITWQREAANAYTDAATSFPDDIKFFDPQNGVIFGDPQNGYFEIYTTSDGGNTWSRVPSNKIPAPLANEIGFTYFADTYLNTIWMITATVDNNYNMVSGRLLQSDDKGVSWYVRNSSLAFSGSDGAIKFRNASIGLYKNNAKLYRTTDGGTTWNAVNYSGTWFSYDFDNVPGKDGWWISTGGDANLSALSAKGFGSSISYDDGNNWVTLDTAVNHTCVFMTSPTHGYSGGITTGTGNDGVFIYH